MIHELIVTSVPRGLQAGRSGFTTVLRTRGLHPQLAETLERASGYRHVFPQGDPRNPRIRAHKVVTGATGVVSVLSRIVDAGSDYSGRSNKLAHHVALDSSETAARAKSNPAAVLLALERSGGFLPQWAGEPREQPAGPHVPTVASEPGACRTWAAAAGDAGWAGLLVDRALARQPTWIIAPPGVDLLELFAEALGLVNYPQRWAITFTTYALSDGDALWLGTLDGSPEAQAARGQSRLAVVDLARRAPLNATSPAIEAARGVAAVAWKVNAPPPTAVGPPPMLLPGESSAAALRVGPGAPPLITPGGPPALNRGQPPLLPGASLDAPAQGDAGWPTLTVRSVPRWRGFALGLLGLVVAVAVVAAVVLLVLRQGWLSESVTGEHQGVVARTSPSPPNTSLPNTSAPNTSARNTATRNTATSNTPTPAPQPPELAASTSLRTHEPGIAGQEEKNKQRELKPAFDSLREALKKARHLPLSADWDLASVAEQSGELCELGSASVEVSLPELRPLALSSDGPQWRLESTGPAGGPWSITMAPEGGAGQPLEIARVESRDSGERRVLMLTLLAVPEAGDAALWATAREALTTAPLVLRLPGEPLPEVETSADFETFVQLCTPKRLPAIEFANLLTDDAWLPKGKKPGKSPELALLPPTPWPCRVELEGRGSGGIKANIEEKGSAPAEPVTLASRREPEVLEVTARWTWPGPEKTQENKEEEKAKNPPDRGAFMATTLVMGNQAIDPTLGGWQFTARVTDSRVLPPWDGWKYLGDPKELLARERAEPLTHLGELPGRVEKLLPVDGRMPPGSLADFGPMALKYSADWKPGKLNSLLGNAEKALRAHNKAGDPSWKDTVRGALVHTAGYRRWVETELRPEPALPKLADIRNAKELANAHQQYANSLQQWQAEVAQRNQEYFPATGVPEEKLTAFWTALKAKIDNPQAKPDSNKPELILDPESIALCCLYEELDGVLQKKKQAKGLLDAVGNGTVTFQGKVWAEAPLSGPHRVLLAEFGAEPNTETSIRNDNDPAQTQEAEEAAAAEAAKPSSVD